MDHMGILTLIGLISLLCGYVCSYHNYITAGVIFAGITVTAYLAMLISMSIRGTY